MNPYRRHPSAPPSSRGVWLLIGLVLLLLVANVAHQGGIG